MLAVSTVLFSGWSYGRAVAQSKAKNRTVLSQPETTDQKSLSDENAHLVEYLVG
jgi:hypothetical protein